MLSRNKIIYIYGLIYVILALTMYVGLRWRYTNNFSMDKVNELIVGKSKYRDVTNDLCKYQILGDPKEKGNYVKVRIICAEGKEANSTLSLNGLLDKTVGGVLTEYARIIGFDKAQYFTKDNFCKADGRLINEEVLIEKLSGTGTIECNINNNEK